MALEKITDFFQPSEKKIKQEVRKNVREIDREIRNLNRDLKKNETEERKVMQNIRKEAQSGNQTKVRQMAKQLVRLRGHSTKIGTMVGSLGDAKIQLQAMSSMQAQMKAMKNVTKMMKKMNSRMSPEKFAEVMKNFQYEREKAEMNQELMDDVMDNGDEELEDEIVDSVLAEIGLQKLEGLGYVPIDDPNKVGEQQGTAPMKQAVAEDGPNDAEEEEKLDGLEARLRELGKGN